MFAPIIVNAHNPGPLTGAGNNTYLLTGGGGAALIDAGSGEPQHVADVERELGARDARLASVLVTHGHPDHAGGASVLASEYPGARFHKFPWRDVDARWNVEWRPLSDGESVPAADEVLVVVHTPGHSPDHVVFWHPPTRTLFCGDLVIPGGSVVIDSTRGGSLTEYLASLERVVALEPARLLPAHGREPANPAAVLRNHLQHRLEREAQVLEALSTGRNTVESIADYIYDGLRPSLIPAARTNVRAHLDKLRSEGRLPGTVPD